MSQTLASRQLLQSVSRTAARLPPDQAAVFLSLMAMEGRSFSLADVLEAVQINRDFASALRFLSHSCPICQEQVSFSKVSRRFEPANQSARSRLMFFSLFPRRSSQ